MKFKVITKHDTVEHFFDLERRAILYAKECNGKIIDCVSKKIVHNFCKSERRFNENDIETSTRIA